MMLSLSSKLGVLNWFRYVFSCVCVSVGLVIWQIRTEYVSVKPPSFGEKYTFDGSNNDLGVRDDLCARLSEPNGYLLLSGTINMQSIDTAQGFFQSADGENGLFFEFDPGEDSLVRFGVRLADETIARLKFKNLRNTGEFSFLLLVDQSGRIRLVGDGTDETSTIGELSVSCDNWQIGSANGSVDFDGQMTMSISTGASVQDANQSLDKYLNDYNSNLPNTTYKWPLYTGLLVLALGNPFRFLRKRIKN